VPGALRFVVAGWLGRILRSTSGIATILLIASHTGSFALAGAVSGMIVLGIAAGGPLWSRAADARGQRLVVPFSLAATVLAAAALVVAVVHALVLPGVVPERSAAPAAIEDAALRRIRARRVGVVRVGGVVRVRGVCRAGGPLWRQREVREQCADFTARRIESALRNLSASPGPSYTESGRGLDLG